MLRWVARCLLPSYVPSLDIQVYVDEWAAAPESAEAGLFVHGTPESLDALLEDGARGRTGRGRRA
eukprot:10949965-Alexandrium_andersonii.AAC.1